MTKELYFLILGQILVPFIEKTFTSGHKLMQDNDPKHVSSYTHEYFLRKSFNWSRTPPESPDLNMWHELKEYIRRKVKPATKDQ